MSTLLVRLGVLSLLLSVTAARAARQILLMPVRDEALNTEARDVLEDRYGFLWFAGSDGLLRYDGHEVRRLLPPASDEQGNVNVLALAQDSARNSLYFSTTRGVFEVSLTDLSVRAVVLDGGADRIRSLHVSAAGELWGCGRRGVYRRAATREAVMRRVWQSAHSADEAVNSPYQAVRAAGRYVYISLWDRLLRYDLESHREAAVLKKLDAPYFLGSGGGFLWMTNGRDVLRVDERTGEEQRLNEMFPAGTNVFDWDVAPDGTGWIATRDGLMHRPAGAQRASPVTLSVPAPGRVPTLPTTVCTDHSGGLWLTTFKQGIHLANLRAQPFAHFAVGRRGDAAVWGIMPTDAEHLLVSTHAAGLWRVDTAGRGAEEVSTPLKLPRGKMTRDRRGGVWLGTFSYGVLHLRDGNAPRQFTPENSALRNWSVRLLQEDRRGRLWIGVVNGGLHYYDPAADTLRAVDLHGRGANATVWPLCWALCDPGWAGGKLLLAVEEEGLYLLDPATGTLMPVRANQGAGRISADVRVIHQASDSVFWLGTYQDGLQRLTFGANGRVRVRTWRRGLTSPVVYAVVPDAAGRFWLSTEGGISRFDPTTGAIRNFGVQDGLVDRQYNFGATYQDPRTGRIYCGGSSGVTHFDPARIGTTSVRVRPVVTRLEVGNRPLAPGDTLDGRVPLTALPYAQRALTLNHGRQPLEFFFSSRHYVAPATCRYRYRLLGYDARAVELPSGRQSAYYPPLPPGDYQLVVEAAVDEGTWGEPFTLSLTVRPRWWQTSWSKLLAALLAVGLVLAGYRRRLHQHHRRQRDLRRRVEASTQELKHKNEEIARQKGALDRQYTTLQELTRMGQQITAMVEVTDIIEGVYAQVNQLLDAPHFAIGLLQRNGETLRFWTRRGAAGALDTSEVPLDTGGRLSIWAVQHDQVRMVNDLPTEAQRVLEAPAPHYARPGAPRSGIYVPLRALDRRVLGVLVVKSPRANGYTAFQRNLLESLATYVAIALDNASAYGRISEQSEQLEAVHKLKVRFFTHVAHEFRTPLTLVTGPLQQLLDRTEDPRSVALLRTMHRSADRLLRLTRQLLDRAGLEEDKLRLEVEPNDPRAHLRELAGAFDFLSEAKRIDFRVEECEGAVATDAPLWYDRDKLEKIVWNLLSNAFRFTPTNGRIRLSWGVVAGELVLWVDNDGPPIPAEHRAQLFVEFWQQAHADHRRSEGTGLGLPYAHRLARLH
ncbi:MAG: GAF domain-containing protein, partial [Catalinimonas sp.]